MIYGKIVALHYPDFTPICYRSSTIIRQIELVDACIKLITGSITQV